MSVIAALIICIISVHSVSNAKPLDPINLRLNDSNLDKLYYVCALHHAIPNQLEGAQKYVTVDVRDLYNITTELSTRIEIVETRMARIREDYPKALLTSEVFALIASNNTNEVYDLAGSLGISVIVMTEDNLNTGVVQFSSQFHGNVFYVPLREFKISVDVKLNEKLASGLILDFFETPKIGYVPSLFAFCILKTLSLSSIIVAGIIVLKNHEEILLMVHQVRPEVKKSKRKAIIPCLCLLCSISVILLAYFFYDIIVYFFIVIFVATGASAMALVISTCLFIKFPSLKKVTFPLCRQDVNGIKFILHFVFLAFTITWCVFRNHPTIGWVMQDIIGVFLIIQILSDISPFVSFKIICLGFLVFVLYDVFFVFITPFFMKSVASSTSSGGSAAVNALLSSNAHEMLTRSRRSVTTPGESIMEAVATGTAGKSGELMPLMFKVSTTIFTGPPPPCSQNRSFVLLGFGDAVMPGILCVFLAFYDACWGRRVPCNFICSLLGYTLGGVVVACVLFVSKMAQPALLYLCPFTLGITLLCAYLRGGCAELSALWTTGLPPPEPSSSSLTVATSGDDPRVHC